MKKKYFVLLESTDAGAFEMGMAIVQMGYTPLFLIDVNNYKADLITALQNFEWINVNTQSEEEIINILSPLKDSIEGIASLVDSRIAMAATISKKMNIAGPDIACIILKDKTSVAELCPEYSLKTITLSDDLDLAKRQAKEYFLDKSVVVKPRLGCGALGMTVLHSEQEKEAFLIKTMDRSSWLMQEFLEGNLYSMEGWLDQKGLNFLGWTSRRKINKTEVEFRFEGYETLPEEITAMAQQAIRLLFSRSKLMSGWFHIEFLISADKKQMAMIDANTGNKFYEVADRVGMLKAAIKEANLESKIEVWCMEETYNQSGFYGIVNKVKQLYPGKKIHGMHGSDVGGMLVRAIYDESLNIIPYAVRRTDNVSATAIRKGAIGMTTPFVENYIKTLQ